MAESRISRIGSGSAEATTITIPVGHKQGDVLLIFAFNDGTTTIPTLPAGWTSIDTTTGTSCAYRLGWKLAISNADTSGTWTNATGLMCHVYRGANPINPFSTALNVNNVNTTIVWSQYTFRSRTDNQWQVAFNAHRSTDTTTLNDSATGYTNIINAQSGVTQNMTSFDTNGPVQTGTPTANENKATGGTSSGWINTQVSLFPPSFIINNYQSAHSISAGVISVSEKIR